MILGPLDRYNGVMGPSKTSDVDDKHRVLILAPPHEIGALLKNTLISDTGCEIFGPYRHSVDGISQLRKSHIDVVVIDMGTTDENPLVSINRILKIDDKAKIIMVSSSSPDHETKCAEGFSKGASSYIQTPPPETKTQNLRDFSARFLEIIHSIASKRRSDGIRQVNNRVSKIKKPSKKPSLRPFQDRRPKAIAIASSTGGPVALHKVIAALSPDFDVPVFITQHMPENFTTVFARGLAKKTNKRVIEPADGETVTPGTIYLAPGGKHMTVAKTTSGVVLHLDQRPPVHFCRPCADLMLESIANAYGADVCMVVLTGMGSDGKAGAEKIIEAGGQVLAQDFDTSIVWGMPGVISEAGYASQILPLDEIAPQLNRLLSSPALR